MRRRGNKGKQKKKKSPELEGKKETKGDEIWEFALNLDSLRSGRGLFRNKAGEPLENCRARNSHQDLEGGFAESSRFPNMRHASNPFRNPGNRGAPKHNTRKVQGDQASPPHQSNSVPCEEKECRALNQV